MKCIGGHSHTMLTTTTASQCLRYIEPICYAEKYSSVLRTLAQNPGSPLLALTGSPPINPLLARLMWCALTGSERLTDRQSDIA